MTKTNRKVGDKFWYVPGYDHPHLLVIPVRIVEIDNFGWWVDEVVGHVLDESDVGSFLFENLKDAKSELAARKTQLPVCDPKGMSTLELYRCSKMKFILRTASKSTSKKSIYRHLKEYKSKKVYT